METGPRFGLDHGYFVAKGWRIAILTQLDGTVALGSKLARWPNDTVDPEAESESRRGTIDRRELLLDAAGLVS